jgi:hypothetical protein
VKDVEPELMWGGEKEVGSEEKKRQEKGAGKLQWDAQVPLEDSLRSNVVRGLGIS